MKSLQRIRNKETQKTSRLGWIIGTAVVSRLAINTSRRFLYPFAPVLSHALGVPLSAITSLIAANQITGILSLFFAPIGDYLGYRLMMTVGLMLLAVGMIGGGVFPWYGTVLFAVFLAGLGKGIFDPALQAYIGKQVPFERRGLVIGIAETCWAGSTLLGIPLVGILIERFHWRLPFFVLGSIALTGMIALRVLIPPDSEYAGSSHHARLNIWQTWRELLHERAAIAVLAYAFLVNAASDTLFVVYGAWLEHAFGLSIMALGFSSIVIGLAELLGEGLTALFADRIGLKRALLLGITFSAVSYMILPPVGTMLPGALLALFLIFISLEFTIVTSLSLFTEIAPQARSTMMSGYFAMAGIGRICGTLLGGALWDTRRIALIAIASAGMSVLALFTLLWGLQEKHKGPHSSPSSNLPDKTA
ncbi:MFS transporter [candidate division KSB3 bacterium]|uniref:MFS transporter n=1 Tax=candidate division KSB3 bacterium TaxID=2044937 RepID=A0A2G6KM40_9BACT|nr:MAG: MFS transporter [candidate division KSB3 bacterium]